jgi:hypothetical protein
MVSFVRAGFEFELVTGLARVIGEETVVETGPNQTKIHVLISHYLPTVDVFSSSAIGKATVKFTAERLTAIDVQHEKDTVY